MPEFQVGAEIELSIDDLNQGEGVGRLDGWVCFVPGALPGEHVKAKVSSVAKRFIRAEALTILKASVHRETPPCPYAAECGGCQYQHVSYPEELRWKEKQVQEAIRRIGKVWPEQFDPIVACPEVYGYRNSITLAQGVLEDKRAWGFFSGDNVSVVPVDRCLLAREPLNRFLGQSMHQERFRPLTSLTIKEGEDGKVVDNAGETFFKMRVLEKLLWANSQGFFQVNIPVAEKIVEKIRAWISPLENFELFDVYAGVGPFGILCGEKAKAVCSIESNKYSLKALRRNLKELRSGFYQVSGGEAEQELIKMFKKNSKGPRVVILDPPREGLDRKFAQKLAEEKSISHLIYISCEASHLARDLNIILNESTSKLFKLVSITPFDMFPRTKHVETAALLVSGG